jgi:hypothetical protein
MSTPSERIHLISEIAQRLGREDWQLIDLTLGQFSLPTSHSWQGDERSYVIGMISDASSNALIQLATHLDIEDLRGERPGVEPSFWIQGYFRLFASHLAHEKEYATRLKESLEQYGISMFLAHKDIVPTNEWQNEILLALKTTDGLVALLTPRFHESEWTDQEVGFVLGRNLLAVAVMLGESPYGFIGRLQAFAGVGKSEEDIAEGIFAALLKNKQTKQRMAHAVVTLFEQSNNFKSAIRNVGLLARIEHWETQFEDRIKNAISSNNQVRDAYRVPDRANQTIQKWAPPSKEAVVDPEDVPFE